MAYFTYTRWSSTAPASVSKYWWEESGEGPTSPFPSHYDQRISYNLMSSASTAAPTFSTFQVLFDAALDKYTKQTGRDLRDHPLTSMIDHCSSPESILAIFEEQSQAFDVFRNGDRKLINWLIPVVNGLHALSTNVALTAGAGLVFPPAKIILSGIGVLLSTAKYVRASHDALVEIFECFENFLRRIKIYTEIPPTYAMTEMITKIMAELLSVLALATRQVNQGRFKKFAKKLLGENDVQSVLQRLDRLTLEESKTTVAQTLDVVYGLVNNMEAVMEDGQASTDDIRQALVLMQELVMKVNKIERDQLQEKFCRWLSTPDPWVNHNIARDAHHDGTARWFKEGDVFTQWKSTGSLLWLHGLPGCGKSILCSTIVEEVREMCRTGLATFAFFYFDFRDAAKQDARSLLSSLLIQLGYQSHDFSQCLSSLYSTHRDGSQQPSIHALMECLKSMFALPGQATLYVVVDALDECPNSFGCPTPRETVLKIMKELIDLHLPHVHFCITSRPEIDIRETLRPLATYNVSLHEQSGQNQDIADYINCTVPSDPMMRRWREEDRQLVIRTLIEKAGGMFRWVHCQVETLRRCFPPSIRRALDELPRTLDETYERALLGIGQEKRDYAYRLFQCLVVSIRPLRAKELAEIFTIQLNAESIPGLNADWRPENPEEFILSACSTLVAVVNVDGEQVVQFSHFSVREYLTSNRIANSTHVSSFHIILKPAHTLLVRACLGVLLQLDHHIDETKIQDFPLAQYAAQYWVGHARVEDVSLDIQEAMECLFDADKPPFSVWLWLYDMETQRSMTTYPVPPSAVPLFYAVRFGLRNIVGHLIHAYPEDVNWMTEFHGTPLLEALYREHPDIAMLLLERGADPNLHHWSDYADYSDDSPLCVASFLGYTKVVRSLLDRGANVNREGRSSLPPMAHGTPLRMASAAGRLDIARMLLERGADVNFVGIRSPLDAASEWGHDQLVLFLLDHHADIDAADDDGYTPLHGASMHGHTSCVQILLEHGSKVDPQTVDQTPLQVAAHAGHADVVRLLLDHGADINNQGRIDWSGTGSPLHSASIGGHLEVLRLLLDRGATVHARTSLHWTALHLAARAGRLQAVEFLLKCGGDPHARNKDGETPFDQASKRNHVQTAKLLSEHMAKETMINPEFMDMELAT